MSNNIELDKLKTECMFKNVDFHVVFQSMLTEYVKTYPENQSEIMLALANGLKHYEENIKKQVNAKSQDALRWLMSVLRTHKKLSFEEAVQCMKAVYCTYTQGFNGGISISDKEFLLMFCEGYFSEKRDRAWENNFLEEELASKYPKSEYGSRYLDMLCVQYEEQINSCN